MSDIETLKAQSLQAVKDAATLPELEEVRVAFLGKKGRLTEIMKTLGTMSVEERKSFGAAVNLAKDELTQTIDARKAELEGFALDARLKQEKVDVTLPTRTRHEGRIHPVTQVIEEAVAIFGEMGFSVAEGPDIEDDYHNFEALNFPADHPARAMHDTFYLKGGKLLRTHTSPVQVRAMKKQKPPLRVLAPGSTFRCDSDMTHTPMFHQIEGLVIEKNIHMGHLKGCLIEFVKTFFEIDDLPVRFRASFFPFTEPSAEMDIGCSREGGTLKLGNGGDWLEILGCGMVHPNVLKACGLDPEEHQGFAFGMGVERLAMLKYGMPDLRAFFDNDIRWLTHYGFGALDIPSLIGGLSQ
ncbi:MAG: phenylalanine--tRNA ligase subunit alpha [Alphaproteobacteria bacterium]|nr:phenylalanine--tRNA ligase subunit alpha [Alphaproteobacteria bacterium]